jgi:hypothetical protein
MKLYPKWSLVKSIPVVVVAAAAADDVRSATLVTASLAMAADAKVVTASTISKREFGLAKNSTKKSCAKNLTRFFSLLPSMTVAQSIASQRLSTKVLYQFSY